MPSAWGDSWGDAWGDSWGGEESTALVGQWSDIIPCKLTQPRMDSRASNERIPTHTNRYRHDSRMDVPRIETETG